MAGRPSLAAFPWILPALLIPLVSHRGVAQQLFPTSPPPLSGAAWVGFASPHGDLGDRNDEGILVGGGLGYRLLPRVTLRAEVSRVRLGRAGPPSLLLPDSTTGPTTTLIPYTVGAQLQLTDPGQTRWRVAAQGTVGGTYLKVRDGPPAIPDASAHEPTVHLSGRVGYQATDALTLFARAGGYGILGNAGEPPTGFGKELFVTHVAGLSVRF